MNILITGANGQLGYELKQTCPEGHEVYYTNTQELDISNQIQVLDLFETLNPDIVINAAAYTKVDQAESEPESCYHVNHCGVENLAKACQQIGARLIHVSTDFVFDGQAIQPYAPTSKTAPLGTYGKAKRAGELALQSVMPSNYAIIRTAWVYSSHGHNFVKTMLRLMSEKSSLSIVNDQFGLPTWANNLAKVCWALALNSQASGLFHYSDAGEGDEAKTGISWFEFAKEIQTLAIEYDLLTQQIPIQGINSAQYPTPASRPHYSVLDSTTCLETCQLPANPWRIALTQMLKQL